MKIILCVVLNWSYFFVFFSTGEITNRDDTVIVRLKELQQKLQTIITEYQILLEMLIAFFKNLTEVILFFFILSFNIYE